MTKAANLAAVGSNANTGGTLITSGTAVASTSGTSIDFTGIPSWVKRITVMFNGVSTNGTSSIQIQIGSSSFTSSGYVSAFTAINSSGTPSWTASTTGFIVGTFNANTDAVHGVFILSTIGSNSWGITGTGYRTVGTNIVGQSSGSFLTLGGVLDRVRITTVNGTDTFDAGSINILYE